MPAEAGTSKPLDWLIFTILSLVISAIIARAKYD